MTTAIKCTPARAKKLPRPEPVKIVPMSASEATESLLLMNRAAVDWSRALLAFSQRQGWQSLGYKDLRSCLADRLRIGVAAAMVVLQAAQVRQELAAIADDGRLQEKVWGMPDSHCTALTRLSEPKDRLSAMRLTHGRSNGSRVTANLLNRTINRMLGRDGLVMTRGPNRERCPQCNGTGFLQPE